MEDEMRVMSAYITRKGPYLTKSFYFIFSNKSLL